MTETYNIPFTNGSNSLVIEPFDVDISTSLALFGKNTPNYWTDFNKNFVLLLSNFSNSTPPLNPITGQTWFDNENKKLKYYDNEWYELKPPIIDLSECVNQKNDTMSGPLVLSGNPTTNTSISTRAYVESKVLDYTYGTAGKVNWIKHSNLYTIMNTYIIQNKQEVVFPFPMADTNYSILITPNETGNSFKPYHYTTYDKTVTGFKTDIYNKFSTLAIVIMGFAAQ